MCQHVTEDEDGRSNRQRNIIHHRQPHFEIPKSGAIEPNVPGLARTRLSARNASPEESGPGLQHYRGFQGPDSCHGEPKDSVLQYIELTTPFTALITLRSLKTDRDW